MRITSIFVLSTLAVASWPAIGEGQAAFTPIAITGKPIPGGEAGAVLKAFYEQDVAVNASGQVAFVGYLEPNESQSGIWISGPTGTHRVVRRGDLAPGAGPDARFVMFSNPKLNASGQLLFDASFRGQGVDDMTNVGFWTGSPGSIDLVARRGSAAVGVGPGVYYSYLNRAALNDAGQVLFDASLTDAATGVDAGQGLYLVASSVQLVASAHEPIPGMAGVTRGWISPAQLSAAGQIAFTTEFMVGSTVTGSGLFVGPPGQLDLVLRNGDPAPGTPAGVTFSYFTPRLSAAGQLLVEGGVSGPDVDDANDEGIWAGPPGALQLVARAGSPAPGVPGKKFNGRYDQVLDDEKTMFIGPTMSRAGHVAFTARLTDEQGQFTPYWGVWAGKPGQLKVIAMRGDAAPGTDKAFACGSPGYESCPFSAPVVGGTGQVAFYANLVDPATWSGNPFDPGNGGIFATDLEGNLHLIARQGDQIDLGDGVLRTIHRPTIYDFNEAGQLLLSFRFTDGSSALAWADVPEPASLLSAVVCAMTMLAARRRRTAA